MGQYWYLVNFDKWEKSPADGKLGEWLLESYTDALLIEGLTLPLRIDDLFNETTLELLARADLSTPEGRHQLGQLALPTEILLNIYEMMDLASAAALGCTNSRLLRLGADYIYGLLVKQEAHWAGDRLMCMGDYHEDEDLPDDFLTAEERKDLRIVRPPSVPKMREHEPEVPYESIVHELHSGEIRMSREQFAKLTSRTVRETPDSYALLLQKEEREEAERKRGSTSLLCFAVEHFCDLPSFIHATKDRARKNAGHITDRLHGYDKDLYDSLTAGEISIGDDDNANTWVLCNLTKHEFVRQEAVVALSEKTKVCGPYMDNAINFGHVLLTLICWSRDPSGIWPDESDWNHGRWAGNRFEITLRTRMRPGEWTDISDAAVKRVREIWDLED